MAQLVQRLQQQSGVVVVPELQLTVLVQDTMVARADHVYGSKQRSIPFHVAINAPLFGIEDLFVSVEAQHPHHSQPALHGTKESLLQVQQQRTTKVLGKLLQRTNLVVLMQETIKWHTGFLKLGLQSS